MTNQKNGFTVAPAVLNNVADEVVRLREETAGKTSTGGVQAETLARPGAPVNTPDPLTFDAAEIQETVSDPATQVGRMPPQPPTLRAKIGSVIVQLVRRSLFWYSAQINETNGRIAQSIDRHAKRISGLANRIDETRADVALLSERTRGEIVTGSRERAKLQKDLEAAVVGMRRQDQDSSAIRRIAEKSAARLRDLTEGLSVSQENVESIRQIADGSVDQIRVLTTGLAAAQNNIAELSTSLRSLDEAQDIIRATVQKEIETSLENSLVLKRTASDQSVHHAGLERAQSEIQDLNRLVQQIRITLQAQNSRISLLTRQNSGAEGAVAGVPSIEPAAPTTQELGPWYVEFENAFRGTRSDIKERVAAYLPRLAASHIGTQEMPVLDLGCGRGEWLEVLTENGLVGMGVDSNQACVDECHDRGWAVDLRDAIEYLGGQPSESFGGITAFHVVEHLPFRTLLELLDQALRVLKPGGILILETPNPGNLLVGAHTFYLDPTHVRPLPADLLRFTVESRSFVNAEIVPLHPFADSYRLDGSENVAAALLNELVYGARDYAIIAQRL